MRCAGCHRRIWFWQKRIEVADPWKGQRIFHDSCHRESQTLARLMEERRAEKASK